MAKSHSRSGSVPAPLIEPDAASSPTVKTIVIAVICLVVAVAMFFFRSAVDQQLLLLLLGMLAIIGVFYLVGSVMGLVHFGSAPTSVNPGSDYLNGLQDGVCITDDSKTVIYANAAYGALAGQSDPSDVQSPEQMLAVHEDASNALYRLVNRLNVGKSGEEEFRLPTGLYREEKESRWYRLRAWPLRLSQRDNSVHAWQLRDITAERDDQERVFVELQQAIDHLDRAPVGFFASDHAGLVNYVNATLAGWLGLDLVRFVPGSLGVEALLGGDAFKLLSDLSGTQDVSRIAVVDTDLVKATGERVPVQLIHRTHRDSDGPNSGSRTIVINRADSGAIAIGGDSGDVRFSRFFNSTPMAIAALDDQGSIIRTNVSFARLFASIAGADELSKQIRFETLLQEDDRDRFQRMFDQALSNHGKIDPFDAILPTKVRNDLTDDEVHVRIFVNPVARPAGVATNGAGSDDSEAVLVYVMDTTEQKGLENQMAQSQKMQAVGQLAGGIAHDFNNVLTAIIMASDLLLSNHRPSDPSFPDIMNIKQNANRAASLVRQLLAFSRRQTLRPEVLSITDVLADLRMLLSRLVGNSIDLQVEHGREIWPVKADLGQFEQVIVNLCVNARDAMTDGGKLTIRTANVEHDQLAHYDYRGLVRDQDYVLIDVMDTGTGIEPDVLKKIFDPFFTTKEVGKGTGLGLSMVYGIVKQTEGHIYADSEVGVGTTFRIFLPRHVPTDEEIAQDEANAAALTSKAPEKRDLSGSATVLLVEDEDAVRMGGVRALQSRGYTVHEAGSGVEALEVMEEIGDQIDLIVSDVMMPEMDGPTLLREVRKMNPDIRFIFVSGYAQDAFEKNLPEGESFGFLPKPFSLKQLATTVKEMLDGEPNA